MTHRFINSGTLGHASGTVVILRGSVDRNAGRVPEFVLSWKTSLDLCAVGSIGKNDIKEDKQILPQSDAK